MENKAICDILGKTKKVSNIKLPKKILTDDSGVPEIIKVTYDDKLNVEYIDEIVQFKLRKIKKKDLLENYLKNSEKRIKNYILNPSKKSLEEYLDICSKYIRIERIKNIKNVFKCKCCGKKLDEMEENSEGIVVCDECNCINTFMSPNVYQKDIDKYNYYFDEDVNNFVKILDKFEGKTKLILGSEFLKKLDSYFLSIGFKKGEEIRKLPMKTDGKKMGTNRKMLWNALEKLGFPQYYDETSYIANIYWGWRLPNLTNYREQLIKDYQITQNLWNSIKVNFKRSASLGTQYRLYVQMKALDYPYCDRSDFKIQDNVDSIRLHNEIWKIMCEKCNIKYFQVSS